jgi:hypothetical protein
VAPHGGRRGKSTTPHPRSRKVNDVHTADLSLRLAGGLDASFIINDSIDRNELDLNRISQVTRRAPWFFEVIEHLLTKILDRHETALVFFVHGWNVTQPRCDVGIGTSVADEDACIEATGKATISQEFLRQRLRPFRHFCEASGIRTTYGERYPASHPNNVLQIFRRPAIAPQAGAVGRISAWAAAGRVEAVQLELGVAVRWPGAVQNSFVAATTRAFGTTPHGVPPAAPLRPHDEASLRPPASLQCFDAANGIGVSAGLAVESGGGIRGRLLLFLGGQRVALFVGEDRRLDRLVSGGPEFQLCDRGFHLGFEGPVLCVEDGGLYLDLEDAFAASALQAVRLDLSFEAPARKRYGRVRGTIGLERRTWSFDCYGFGGVPLRTSTPLRRSQTVFSACFGAELALQVQTGDPRGAACGKVTRITAGEERSDDLCALSVLLEHDGYTPRRITVPLTGKNTIVAEPLNRMSIYRPGVGNRPARVTFGIARVRVDDRRGFGFYEHSRPLRTVAIA